MDLFTRLERAVEHLFEGVFSHRFHGRVQPVEIARRLTRAMEDGKLVSVSQVFVPNQFRVALHPEDYATIAPFREAIIPELARHVQDSAAQEKYGLLGRPEVLLIEEPDVERGAMRIDTAFIRREDQALQQPDTPTSALAPGASPGPGSAQQAVLQVIAGPEAGDEFPLVRTHHSIGRGGPNDIALSDSSVSRSHAEIELRPDGYYLRDLGSKNGSCVNGLPSAETLLSDGDEVSVGATTFRFHSTRRV